MTRKPVEGSVLLGVPVIVTVLPFTGDRSYSAANAATMIDGEGVLMQSFVLMDDNGGGYTYYKLRDLGQALGFNVGWSSEKGVYIETDRPYDPGN